MDSRKRYSDPLTNFEKQSVSFLNERQSIFKDSVVGEDVPDAALASPVHLKSETKNKTEPKNSKSAVFNKIVMHFFNF